MINNLKFNLNSRYNPTIPFNSKNFSDVKSLIPIFKNSTEEEIVDLGMNKNLLKVNLISMEKPEKELRSAKGKLYMYCY